MNKKSEKETFYITTAIDYLNGRPHIGHGLEKVIADVLARYHRLKGDDTFFLTGTDEHGKKNYKTAKDEGMKPKKFVDKMAPKFKNLKEFLNLSFDDFIRTSDRNRHYPTAQKIWKKLKDKGDIYKKDYEGLYCSGCESFVKERDLEDGKCPIHDKEPELVSEENYFFRLSKYAEEVKKLIESGEVEVLPETRRNEILDMIEDGVDDVSFSRERESLPWGIPVPGDKSQVMYVWCDALTNYLSGIGYMENKEKFNRYWPADIHLIGKDIHKFHALIWPAMLLSAGIKLPKMILIHGFFTVNGKKMSKSLGNVIYPNEEAEKFGIDPFRYALLTAIPTLEDGDFSEEVLIKKLNSELADNLGNFVNRALKFIDSNFDRIPNPKLTEKEKKTLEDMNKNIEEVETELEEEFHLHRALGKIMKISSIGNQHFQENEPWETIKSDEEKCERTLYVCANIIKSLGIILEPFLPQTAERIWNFLGMESDIHKEDWDRAKKLELGGKKINEPELLFEKIDEDEISKSEEQKEGGEEKMISFDEFQELDLKIGKIEKVEPIQDSDKLVKMQIDLGDQTKQSVGGFKKYYSPEELVGKKVPVLVNLEPSELMGVKSECMVLAAVVDDDKPVLLNPEEDLDPGQKVM